MTVALWIIALWVVLSVVFVGVGMWWINRPRTSGRSDELATVTVLYPTSGRSVQGSPQKPPRSCA